YVLGMASFEQILKSTPFDNLKVITAGDSNASPAKILSSDRFKELMEELKNHFDFIIIDAPPILPLADVPILLNHADGLALIVEAGKTPRQLVKTAVSMLDQSRKGRILGYVLTRAIENTIPEYARRYFVGGL